MLLQERLPLAQVEMRVCALVSKQLGIPRSQMSLASRLVEDLGCDSLDLVELIMELEENFAIALPNDAPHAIYKAVFTRQPFRVADLAELVYLQQGTGTPTRGKLREPRRQVALAAAPFTQLGGRYHPYSEQGLLEPLAAAGPEPQFRRRTDGMRCIQIPAANVEIGTDGPDACPDEQPQHVVHLDAFLIDAEPVSTTAYCRFLNSIGAIGGEILADWFVLDPQDDRNEQVVIASVNQEWQPISVAEHWPMILVSWYGANAYSLWANGKDWTDWRAEGGSYLPSEAQWEYAARGARWQPFPWGAAPASPKRMRYAQHHRSATYGADSLPMADVNDLLGMSPFGVHHMAGNVWQWCRDWYDVSYYQRAESRAANPVNRQATLVRSERGGSWVGLEELCRSSYRRGRPPMARGRCLGFRCISTAIA